MRIVTIHGSNIAVSSVSEIIEKKYQAERMPVDTAVLKGKRILSKAETSKKQVSAPYSMAKLLDLYDADEYQGGCIEAIYNATVMQVQCKNQKVLDWLKSAEYPSCEEETSILQEFIKNYAACGNGFLIKMRGAGGKWSGLERLLPSETAIMESYDSYGFLRPIYVQVKNGKKVEFPYADVIHLKKSTHRSNAWGLASLPVAINVEILGEIKKFDYNNFKNGLLLDYFMIVEGGTLRDGTITNEAGEEVISDAFSEIQKQLSAAKGTANAHSTILIESENKDVKIRLEPLRQTAPDGGFISLKKDLREGIFAYHRVPPRLVSQLVPGQLGGDNRTDMQIFYQFVIAPLQRRLASVLAYEFNYEFQWNVSPDDFNFGNLTESILSPDETLFNNLRNN